MKSMTSRALMLIITLCLSFIIFGCGGGGSGSSNSSASSTTVSGTVFAGPVTGSIVIVKSGGVEVARSSTSTADGSYSVSIPTSALANNLVFETSGGTYTDEGSGSAGITLGTFSAYAAAGSLTAGSNVVVDPSSTIIQKLVAAGKNKAQAETAFTNAFGYTPDYTTKPVPADITSATDGQRLAGLRAAAFSKLANTLGIPAAKQHELLQALADDLSDDVLDGNKTGSIPVTTTSGTSIPADVCCKFGTALLDYNTSLGANKITSDKIGTLPFAKKALTASYIVEYIPGMMAATAGKSTFKIKLSNGNGTPATGKSIALMPKMYMPTMSHTAPADTVVESSTPGTYDCTVYYLMASGPGMGYWELKVMIGMESAYFYPPVGMAMGAATQRATLKGITDTYPGMMGASKRTYYIFPDGLSTAGGSYTFKLFIAAADDAMMMSYPAVSIGTVLHDGSNTPYSVAAMTVDASTDGGATWNYTASPGLRNGQWTLSPIAGLTAGTNGTVLIRLSVNGEQKSTDGNSASGANGYATFTVTP